MTAASASSSEANAPREIPSSASQSSNTAPYYLPIMATRRTAAIDAGLQFGLRNRWYPVDERWGIIWAYIGETDLFPAPPLRLPDEMIAADWAGHIARATWHANWLLVLDNLMDPMHASWLHARSYTLGKGKKSARMAV